MKIFHGLNDSKITPTKRAIAIGIFDGVHRGHQKILDTLLRKARKNKARAMVVTFDPHPNKVLRHEPAPPIILSLKHRLRLLDRMGIDEAVVIHFDKKFSKISHTRFTELLLKRLGLVALSVGHDFRFGNKGLGNEDYLKGKSRALGFSLSIAKPLKYQREIISSTRIRQLIEKGNLKKAEKMLGRPVSVYGDVVRGRGRGKKVGFPTANLNPHHETLPPSGVYAAWGYLGKRKLKGVIHIGQRPTFKDKQASLEVHFLHFNRNIYGKELELIFVSKLRETKRFRDMATLAKAIKNDAKKAAKLLA
jgi:riboflavin kinase / FMN adenylyltransferase